MLWIWGLFPPPGWLYVLYHFLFLFYYHPKAKVHNVSDGSFWLEFWGKSISRRGEERRLSGEKIKLSLLKVCWRFHETEAIINMQWHMHTSKMIPDASSWIIKFPKVPFIHRLLRVPNHSAYETQRLHQDILEEGRRDRREAGEWLLCFIRLSRQNCISFEQFDFVAGRRGAPSTGDVKVNEQIVGFAWLGRRLNGSCKLLSVRDMVDSYISFVAGLPFSPMLWFCFRVFTK